MEKVKKQYGLWTGIAMVIGIVIGSGVFIKGGKVLAQSGGDLKLSLLAWLVGGLIMIASGFCFAVFATKVTKYNGVIDYVETTTNKKVGYGLAWLMTTFYYPIICSIVAVFSGMYFLQIFDPSINITSWPVYIFAFAMITLFMLLNYYSPVLAAKFQVSSTVIKLIPIVVIAVVGLFASLIVGDGFGVINAIKNPATDVAAATNFGEAIKITAFAYEGWVCATAINAELKDSKRNLPKALTYGTIAILAFYIIYYVGLSAFLGNGGVISTDSTAPIAIFTEIMGKAGGIIFGLLITISCLGTVNGLTIACCRGMYTMACRGQGIAPEKVSKLGKNQSVSFLSCLYGYGCIILMLIIWICVFQGVKPFTTYLGSMDEIVCAIIYAVYITLYVYIIKNFKEYGVFKRYVMPIIAIIGSLFFVICGTGLFQYLTTGSTASLESFLVFLVLFAILMVPSIFFYKKDAKGVAELED